MKIRCGSHQQNRSIVRPGLSLMATKVALTAEEFRENSQRSIALFNTEKLSTDSTHVLKSAYCILCISAVAICTERVEAKQLRLTPANHFIRCNLHGACGGKGGCHLRIAIAYGCNLHGACGGKEIACIHAPRHTRCNLHGACGGKVSVVDANSLYSSVAICTGRVEDLASSSEKNPRKFMQTYCIFIHLGV